LAASELAIGNGIEFESKSHGPDSVRHSVSSQRSVGQKWQRGSISDIYVYISTYDSPFRFLFLGFVFFSFWLFGWEGPLGGEPAGSNRNYIFKVFSCTLLGALIFSYFCNFN